MQSSIEIASRLRKIPSVEFVFAGDEITRSSDGRLGCFFQRSKLVGINLSAVNDLRRQVAVDVYIRVWDERRQVVLRTLGRCNFGRNAARFHAINQSSWNGVGVVAYVVLQV